MCVLVFHYFPLLLCFSGVSWSQVILLQSACHTHRTAEGSWRAVPAYAHHGKPPSPNPLTLPHTLTPSHLTPPHSTHTTHTLIGEQSESVLLETKVLRLHQGAWSNGPEDTKSSYERRLLHGTLQAGEKGKVIKTYLILFSVFYLQQRVSDSLKSFYATLFHYNS